MPDNGVDFMAKDPFDFEHDPAVVEQQGIAGADIFRQILVIEPDTFLIAEFATCVEDEAVVGFQCDLAILKLANPDFRPLQIGKDADRTAQFGSDLADGIGQRNVIFGLAVREIQADDVNAGTEQFFEGFGSVGSRAEGGDDLGMAGHECPSDDVPRGQVGGEDG